MTTQFRTPLAYGWAFWGATALTAVLWLAPVGSQLIYPFSILATWAHEMGHGLTAILTGGDFDKLALHADGSGMAHTRVANAAAHALVCAGGLIAVPLLGTMIVAAGAWQSLARPILWLLAAALGLTALVWARNLFGFFACCALAASLGLAARYLRPRWRFILVQFLGIQLSLSALRRWDYLFSQGVVMHGEVLPSDVSAIAMAVGGHYLFWGLLITGLNLGLLYAAFRVANRRLSREDAYGELGMDPVTPDAFAEID